uniref:Secreted protein n=1 Tax=Angiostrongylus cantonensis TaxID=6313 RepID=A0A0K0CVU6_ANGCA
MAVLILALLHYITIASSKSAFSFYGSSAYGAVHGDQPMDRHSVHTAIKSLSVEEDIELNVPHPINGDTIASSKDDTVKKVEERTLPILRADSEPLKPSDQQETTYIHEDTSDREMVPVRKILKEADVLNVNHNERNILEQKVVFRNTFTHVEVVPTDTAPAIIATTAASPPIASLRAMTTSTSNSEVSKTTLELTEQEVTEIQTEGKSLGGRQDLGINSEMPSTETFVINKEETKLAISSIDDLSQSSVLAPAIGEENLADSRHKLLEQKSSEDDDTDIFVDLDEKSDADIEFQDSEAIPSAVVRPSSTASTTPTCNTTIDESRVL